VTNVSRFGRLAALILGWGLAGCAASPPSVPPAPDVPVPDSLVWSDVDFLASPALGGREAGTEGARRAAIFIATRYASYGMPGAFLKSCDNPAPCPEAYFQTFVLNQSRARNVGAVIRGADSSQRGTWVVIGAHFDHLGTNPERSLDPERGGLMRPGADDNASGTSAVLALAARFSRNPPPFSLLFVNFDAEESGLNGSRVFTSVPPVALDSVLLMVNLDMVGRLENSPLMVELVGGARDHRDMLDSIAAQRAFPVRFPNSIQGRSDHMSFASVGVPALHFYTGYHADYHRATDVAHKLDYAGLDRIIRFAEEVIRGARRSGR
jgi:hypothetical protein